MDLAKVIDSSDVKTTRTRGPRYAKYPAGLPDPLPGTNPPRNDPALLYSLGLSWSEEQVRSSQSSIPVYVYKELANPYPPERRWIVESAEAAEQLQDWFDITPRNDKRQERLGITLLDPNQLQRVVSEGESATLIDRRTGRPFGAVIRKFVENEAVLPDMDSFAATQVEIARSIRVRSSLWLLH